ncbi:MAG: BTAD domain-containing putative transcriptional regulator, partial [Anaerolineales bacterium]
MLKIRLLGQFDLRMERKRITIPSRVGQSLLAYLALTAGTSHRREKLAGIFWPDTTDENSRKYLRQELWRIRKIIAAQKPTDAEYILADEFSLSFNRDAEYWLDVALIEQSDYDLQSLITNLSLYQGELLPGFYDDWIILERERLQTIFDARMDQLLEQLVASERWIAVQEWGERWLSLSGVREPAYRALMLASGVRGDMARVGSLYQRCIEELMENLGVEPSAETRAMYEGLLKGAKVSKKSPKFLSSGTVTFLFTDIEASTRLLSKLGKGYKNILIDYHKIILSAIEKWNGKELDRQGDSFFVTFPRALDAVQCAADLQRTFTEHTWTEEEPVRVRMGLHSGESLINSPKYVGMDVHRAARIGDAGHGGQILLSQTTRELVIDSLPPDITIRDLGDQNLKDLKSPTAIYQLLVDGLQSEFLPLRSKFTGKEAPIPGDPPFKGLQYFTEADSDLFFGREQIKAKLANHLCNGHCLSVIVGASGSGKSSIVRAGLVPALKKDGPVLESTKQNADSDNWKVRVITPTAQPIQMLATKLTDQVESVSATATLIDDLMQDPRSLYLFLSRSKHNQKTVLVVDQFEELFTLCRDEFEREAYIDNLLTALDSLNGSFILIITLRADFYSHLSQYPALRDLAVTHQEYIGPMTTEELRRAIEEPAKRGLWEFETGLVDLILRDIGDEPGALPLLSHALLETWKRRAGHMLTLQGYEDAGGVHGAIAQTAENIYNSFSAPDQTILRNIFLRLTEFGEGTEDTRRRASLKELISHEGDTDRITAILNKLAEARLVTLAEDSAEVAHEALIREWPQLREWLMEDREGILLHRHLTDSTREWELLERDPGALYRGARLAQTNEWEA